MGGWRNLQRCVDRLAGTIIGGAKPRSYIDEDVKANWNELEKALQTVGAADVPAALINGAAAVRKLVAEGYNVEIGPYGALQGKLLTGIQKNSRTQIKKCCDGS